MAGMIRHSDFLRHCVPPTWSCTPFPILQRAVNEVTFDSKAPIKMVYHCGATAMFSAVQGVGDFERPGGGSAPLSQISFIAGDSGERKSSVDRPFYRELKKFRELIEENACRAEVLHSIREKKWVIQQKKLDKRLSNEMAEDGSVGTELMEALMKHGLLRPKPASKSQFFYEDTSLTLLKRELATYPFACIHSSEGMSILKGPLFEEKNLLLSLYSGDTYFFDRANFHTALEGRRICVSAHAPTKQLLRFLAREGEEFLDSGLAARMTICLAGTTQGARTFDGVPTTTTVCDQFNERVRYLLKLTARTVGNSTFVRRQIKFDAHAAREYIAYANWIENEMNPGGRFFLAKEYANRLAEKVGRLSAAIHLFEDFEGDMSLDTFNAARSFYHEESIDSLYLFNYVPSDDYRADQLYNWLENRLSRRQQLSIKKSEIMQFCSSNFRKKVALDPLIDMLEKQGRIRLAVLNKTTWVALTSSFGYRQPVLQDIAAFAVPPMVRDPYC